MKHKALLILALALLACPRLMAQYASSSPVATSNGYKDFQTTTSLKFYTCDGHSMVLMARLCGVGKFIDVARSKRKVIITFENGDTLSVTRNDIYEDYQWHQIRQGTGFYTTCFYNVPDMNRLLGQYITKMSFATDSGYPIEEVIPEGYVEEFNDRLCAAIEEARNNWRNKAFVCDSLGVKD